MKYISGFWVVFGLIVIGCILNDLYTTKTKTDNEKFKLEVKKDSLEVEKLKLLKNK